VPLSDVGAQVRLVSVGSLAKWAFQLGSSSRGCRSVAGGIRNLNSDAGQVTGRDAEGRRQRDVVEVGAARDEAVPQAVLERG